ncbi:MAG: hypothetical protein ACK4Z0_05135 [Sphingomonadaceae bacterium]
MNRQLHLVAYDVACPARLRRALDAVKPWRASGQKSVAECFLSAGEREALCRTLEGLLEPAEDRLHVLRLDPRMPTELFGVARQHAGGAFIVG